MRALVDFVLHIDDRLFELTAEYGAWVYGIVFLIVFAETGLVVTPILPGDSLLFAAGALCGAELLNPWIMAVTLLAAAIIGDAVNYSLLNREHLAKAHAFFEKHGGKAIVIARFVPIVRTFVPFVAGAGYMSYSAFAAYNVIGAFLWVGSCFGLGYVFGNIPVVKENFSLVAIVIIIVSVLPIVWEFFKARRLRAAASSTR
jgi:membrane-associated protein